MEREDRVRPCRCAHLEQRTSSFIIPGKHQLLIEFESISLKIFLPIGKTATEIAYGINQIAFLLSEWLLVFHDVSGLTALMFDRCKGTDLFQNKQGHGDSLLDILFFSLIASNLVWYPEVPMQEPRAQCLTAVKTLAPQRLRPSHSSDSSVDTMSAFVLSPQPEKARTKRPSRS